MANLDTTDGMRASVAAVAAKARAEWDGFPPDRTLVGYHWLQNRRGDLMPYRYMPKAGKFPGGWESIGHDRLWTESGVAKNGWRYVSPIAWPHYQWVPKPRVRVHAVGVCNNAA